MLEENMIAWREKFRREARQEGEVRGMRKLLLQVMTQRFGRLPLQTRRQVPEL
jgi:hypothetical protein